MGKHRNIIDVVYYAAIYFVLTALSVQGQNCSRSYFGSAGSGIIQSYNFPFDVINHLYCQHRIVVDHLDDSLGNYICFTFRRFLMDENAKLGFYDTASDAIYWYHLLGTLKGIETVHSRNAVKRPSERRAEAHGRALPPDGPAPPPGGQTSAHNAATSGPFQRDHVWNQPWCWNITPHDIKVAEVFLIIFDTDYVDGTGFYAHYDIVTMNATDDWRANAGVDTSVTSDTANVGNLDDEVLYDEAPCPGLNFTCFNRRCSRLYEICPYATSDYCGDSSGLSYAHARCDNDISFRACDFQKNLGNITAVNWEENWTFRTTSEKDGPDRDHTTLDRGGSAHVYWTSFSTPGERADMYDNSTVLDTTYHGTHCFSFWYFMYGNDVGTLGVYFSGDTAREAPLWKRTGNFGDFWRHGELELEEDALVEHLGEMLVFSAFHASDMSTVISLDDISLYEGTCLGEDASCNFETGTCGWKLDADSWLHHKGIYVKDSFLLPGDHSTNNGDGYYLIYDSVLHTGQDDALMSPVDIYDEQPYLDDVCVSFWVFSQLSFSGVVPLLELRTVDNSGRGEHLVDTLDSQSQITHNTWQQITFEIRELTPYKIKLVPLDVTEGPYLLAVDEFVYLAGSCSEVEIETGCLYGEFKCGDDTCINASLVLDGHDDCGHGEDEGATASCLDGRCQYGEFCCLNGYQCVPNVDTCDHDRDCDDWSDEQFCADREDHCMEWDLLCRGSIYRCISDQQICDGMIECPEGDDEEHCAFRKASISVGVCITFAMLVAIALIMICMTSREKRARAEGRHPDMNSAPEVRVRQQIPADALAVGNFHEVPGGLSPEESVLGPPMDGFMAPGYGYGLAMGATTGMVSEQRTALADPDTRSLPPDYTEIFETKTPME